MNIAEISTTVKMVMLICCRCSICWMPVNQGSSGAVILEDVVKEIGAEYEKSIRSWLQAEEYQ